MERDQCSNVTWNAVRFEMGMKMDMRNVVLSESSMMGRGRWNVWGTMTFFSKKIFYKQYVVYNYYPILTEK